MTNEELDLRIARLVGLGVYKDKINGNWYCMKGGTINNPIPKYSTNWNDLMPLVVEHRINFYRDTKGRFCAYTKKDINAYNNNPQRALAECLLKVLEAKDE